MESGIDPGLVWNGVLTVVIAVGIYMGNRYSKKQDDQDGRIRDLEISMPRDYVSKKSLSEQLGRIEGDIKEMKSLLINRILDDKEH